MEFLKLLKLVISFFSMSDVINLFSGILLWVTFKSQKDQFKEQNQSSEKQFKEQFEQSKNQLKEQNELAIKKDKRMLYTQIHVSKLEDFYAILEEYLVFIDTDIDNTKQFLDQSKSYEDCLVIHKDLLKKENGCLIKIKLLSIYFPDLNYDHILFTKSYKSLSALLKEYIKEPEGTFSYYSMDDIDLIDNTNKLQTQDFITDTNKNLFETIKINQIEITQTCERLKEEIEKTILNIMKDLDNDL